MVKCTYFSFEDELGDDDRVVLGHLGCHVEVGLQVVVAVDNVHGSTAEDVRGADEARVADYLAELASRVHVRQFLPTGLGDVHGVQRSRELEPKRQRKAETVHGLGQMLNKDKFERYQQERHIKKISRRETY